MPLDNPMAYLKSDKAAGGKAKEKMQGLLKRMMAAKLKAKLGKAYGGEESPEEESAEASLEDGAEPKSEENELPEEDMAVLKALYEKLK